MAEKSCSISRRGWICGKEFSLLPGQIRRNSRKNFREAISFAGSIGSLGRKHRRSAEKSGQILNFHAFDQENKGFLHSGCQIRVPGLLRAAAVLRRRPDLQGSCRVPFLFPQKFSLSVFLWVILCEWKEFYDNCLSISIS